MDSNNYISVSDVNNYIKNIFDAEYLLQNIFIYGEVGSYSVSNGIAYFNLKDLNNILPCVLFNANLFKTPKIGDLVLLKGSVNYYTKGGKLSFNAVSIQEFGKGLLYEKFIELKNKLEIMGYFDSNRKKQLPRYVKKIGVVSSETGAVIQDMINVTKRRNDSVDIVLFPVKVQGVGAEFEIAKGVEFFNSSCESVDCIIVARGGGSLEDLQPFNTEVVASAIYNSKLPVVSAVGHETDYTICDFVSDLRAPTPSAAAEIVVFDKNVFVNDMVNKNKNMFFNITNKLKYYYTILNKFVYKFEIELRKLDSLKSVVFNKVTKIADLFLDNVNDAYANLIKFDGKLEVLNPANYSKKGLFQIFDANGNLIKNIDKFEKDKMIKIVAHNGSVNAIINSENDEVWKWLLKKKLIV